MSTKKSTKSVRAAGVGEGDMRPEEMGVTYKLERIADDAMSAMVIKMTREMAKIDIGESSEMYAWARRRYAGLELIEYHDIVTCVWV